ncbi:fungal specific transcription factor domain-containing protein [Colletotrichum lupini]|uniref:Fungal specific transcription factor domain-containing protein n=3 Tax=Colletotrichum acutatum species complex TaxID=2707335 RepID=A0A9Q8SLF4_9PEZI|nr:fungal specific transcription factor domain-containing protein [Colletotrichum lupini]XP_060316345.1 fungal specific transcription factor domain-containing protein [Colletotrichum costaricense]KAI3534252.1 fungal specific transcription factor domain-containing protein [Colletotrichum filicis]KAK0381327.1 fungal specific transcription factor domain-containing protein [Colletotrichum limetticola]KAK1532222.1 fungal specific transcription factor domain-containing protein [Colletotrichum costari
MPRSSFSDNPLLRVSRPVSACSRCRAAKVKCDGKLPACTACEKAGRENECSSANDQFARGKERSYVAALELRVEKLEKRLAFARSRKASVNLHDVDEATAAPADRKDSLANIRAAIHRKAARKREDSDVNALVSDFGFLSVNATTRDFEPSVSGMTFARLVLAAATNDEVPDPTEDSFPTRAEAFATVQYYMANVYSLFPSFSETHLLTVLDDVYQQDERVKDRLKDADFWLLYMVLAIGYAAQSRDKNDDFSRRGLDFVARALPFADKALMPGYPSQIQSLILFTQYSMLDPGHFDSWYLIGFASRAVVDLGFHQDPPQLQVPDKAALDLRRKMFYCVYALDRMISMVRARSFSFTDDSINVEYPSNSGLTSGPITGPQSADSALVLFQLRRLQSEWYQTLFQGDAAPLSDAASFIWQMCLEMREWHESLPDNLPSGIREFFELELRYSYIHCLAPSDRQPHLTDYTRKLIFEHAIAYMNTIHSVVHGSVNTAFYSSLDALKVFFVATQFFVVFNDKRELLISEQRIIPPITRPGTAPPPPLPHRPAGGEDSLDRSMRCLQQVVETLARYSQRWDIALQLKTTFEGLSSELFSWLQVRRQMREQGQLPQQHQQQMQQQHQQSPHQPQQQQQQHQPQQQPLYHPHQQSSPIPHGPSPPLGQHPQHPQHAQHPSYPPHPHPQALMGQQQVSMQSMMQQQLQGQPMMQYRWVGDGGGQMMPGPPGQGPPM